MDHTNPILVDAPQPIELPVADGVALAAISQRYGCDALVKLRPEDTIGVGGPNLLHINAAPCSHVVGQRCAFVQLSRLSREHEHVAPWVYTRPLWLGLVARHEALGSALDVPEHCLSALIGRPRSQAALLDLLIGRYSATRGWSPENITQQPVVLTWFEGSPIDATTRSAGRERHQGATVDRAPIGLSRAAQ